MSDCSPQGNGCWTKANLFSGCLSEVTSCWAGVLGVLFEVFWSWAEERDSWTKVSLCRTRVPWWSTGVPCCCTRGTWCCTVAPLLCTWVTCCCTMVRVCWTVVIGRLTVVMNGCVEVNCSWLLASPSFPIVSSFRKIYNLIYVYNCSISICTKNGTSNPKLTTV